MDKTIWLSVIREELGLLNSLATGMIDDATLTREEIELAISRSKVVVSEFEMLLNNLPTSGSQEKWREETGAKPEKGPVASTEPVIPETLVTEEIEFSRKEEKGPVPAVQPEDSPFSPLSPSPSHPLVSSISSVRFGNSPTNLSLNNDNNLPFHRFCRKMGEYI
ncbi:MAG: hypothetical protein M1292_07790 [Bacteroidetes bacterium]|nr:hypothetical protein [Bacteroidota bacterium]